MRQSCFGLGRDIQRKKRKRVTLQNHKAEPYLRVLCLASSCMYEANSDRLWVV